MQSDTFPCDRLWVGTKGICQQKLLLLISKFIHINALQIPYLFASYLGVIQDFAHGTVQRLEIIAF